MNKIESHFVEEIEKSITSLTEKLSLENNKFKLNSKTYTNKNSYFFFNKILFSKRKDTSVINLRVFKEISKSFIDKKNAFCDYNQNLLINSRKVSKSLKLISNRKFNHTFIESLNINSNQNYKDYLDIKSINTSKDICIKKYIKIISKILEVTSKITKLYYSKFQKNMNNKKITNCLLNVIIIQINNDSLKLNNYNIKYNIINILEYTTMNQVLFSYEKIYKLLLLLNSIRKEIIHNTHLIYYNIQLYVYKSLNIIKKIEFIFKEDYYINLLYKIKLSIYSNYYNNNINNKLNISNINNKYHFCNIINTNIKLESYSNKTIRLPFKYNLVLDLDETLISTEIINHELHKNFILKKKSECNFLVSNNTIAVYKRPYLNEFITFSCNNFNVFIFSAGEEKYVEEVLEKLKLKDCIKFTFSRKHCIKIDYLYIKDLSLIPNYNKTNTLIIDNCIYSFSNNLDEGILINSYLKLNKNDKELLYVMNYLKEVLLESSRKFNNIVKVNKSNFIYNKLTQ